MERRAYDAHPCGDPSGGGADADDAGGGDMPVARRVSCKWTLEVLLTLALTLAQILTLTLTGPKAAARLRRAATSGAWCASEYLTP